MKQDALGRLSDDALLSLRLCDLPATFGGELRRRLSVFSKELAKKRFRFRPHFWLSNEWFSPDGVPGIAIPFYLTHPRLTALERRMIGHVEGGPEAECLRILRHETGHAVANAFRLREIPEIQEAFGEFRRPYPFFYKPRPYSRRFVRHLEHGYAQSHPDEDFAETFAVWLGTPESVWRRRYRGWPALRKLEVISSWMAKLGKRPVPPLPFHPIDPLPELTLTLEAHYRKRRRAFFRRPSPTFDRAMRQLFPMGGSRSPKMTAEEFLRKIRKEVCHDVAGLTGEYLYIVDGVLEDLLQRSRELKLVARSPLREAKSGFASLLAAQTRTFRASGRHRIAL